jgi:O-antigen ligase
MFKLLIAGGAVLTAISYGLSTFSDEETLTRRSESNAGRAAGIEVGIIAVARSPIIGYGSWTENRELAELFLKKQREYGGDKQYRERAGAFFSPHSQVLQAWVEGGILGAAFFAFLLYQVVRSARWTVKFRPLDSLTPLLLNFLLFGAWALLMSPFGSSRLAIATLAAIVLMLRVEGTVAQPRAAP